MIDKKKLPFYFSIDFEDFLDDLIEYNKNILFLIPRDFETTSVRVSDNRMLSKVVIGVDQIPNPEINRIEAELRSAERDYLIAERNFQRSEVTLLLVSLLPLKICLPGNVTQLGSNNQQNGVENKKK